MADINDTNNFFHTFMTLLYFFHFKNTSYSQLSLKHARSVPPLNLFHTFMTLLYFFRFKNTSSSQLFLKHARSSLSLKSFNVNFT